MPRPVPIPPDVTAHCDQLLQRRRAPALLALVVMGRVSTVQVSKIHHLSDAVDALYDDAEQRALDAHEDMVALMRNDLALAQLRELRRRRVA